MAPVWIICNRFNSSGPKQSNRRFNRFLTVGPVNQWTDGLTGSKSGLVLITLLLVQSQLPDANPACCPIDHHHQQSSASSVVKLYKQIASTLAREWPEDNRLPFGKYSTYLLFIISTALILHSLFIWITFCSVQIAWVVGRRDLSVSNDDYYAKCIWAKN